MCQEHGIDVIADHHASRRFIRELSIKAEAHRLEEVMDFSKSFTGKLTKILRGCVAMWRSPFTLRFVIEK